MRIATRDCRVGWDFRKDFWAFRAVVGREEIWEGEAEGRVRMGWLVVGDMVVMVCGLALEEDVVVSPLGGSVEVLSWVILDGWF